MGLARMRVVLEIHGGEIKRWVECVFSWVARCGAGVVGLKRGGEGNFFFRATIRPRRWDEEGCGYGCVDGG
jgi:hypothetical protein